MKALPTVSALLEAGAGLALLCVPSAFAGLVLGGALETPPALVVARVGGGGLFALAIACFIGRDDSRSRAARGVIVALAGYNLATVATLTLAGTGAGLRGAGLWPVVGLHAVMGAWCVACLVRRRGGVDRAGAATPGAP